MKTASFWTDNRKDRLRLGYMLGLDSRQIAGELGCSEWDVAAQAVRMNLKRKRDIEVVVRA